MKTSLYSIILFLTLLSCGEIDKKAAISEIAKTYLDGNIGEAKKEMESFLSIHKKNELGWILLGNMNLDLAMDSLAAVAYHKALAVDPNAVEALTGLGIVSRRIGDFSMASEYYLQAVEVDPDYAPAYSSLVIIYIKQKKYKEALEVGLKGYRLDDTDPIIAANLSGCYHYLGDTINREKYYNIAAEKGYKKLESLRYLYDRD